jgi:cell division septation protein DedD
MRSDDDTEITLGAGKLLGLFFVLAVICGVFFSIGYSLGRSSGREQALSDQPAQVNTPSDSGATTSAASENKPSATAANPQAQVPTTDESDTASQPGHFTFYKAVQQSDNGPQVTEAAQPATRTRDSSVVTAAAPMEKSTELAPGRAHATGTSPKAELAGGPGPEVVSHSSPVTGPGTLVVQIAAVSREDDAVALAGALRKKNYNVFVVNNPVTHDRFFHVQVGPFSTLAQAEAMKSKLSAEGYNPIIKR